MGLQAYELSVLTGTQVLLLVVSETGLVYTFTTPKLQPLVTKPEGKNLIQVKHISSLATIFLTLPSRRVSMLQNQPAIRMALTLAMSPNLPKRSPPSLPTMAACPVFLKVATCLSNKSTIHTMQCRLRVVNTPACLECLNINAAPSRLTGCLLEEEPNVVS